MPGPEAQPLIDRDHEVTYGGRRYLLLRGRIVLDWRNRPMRFHSEDCVLCCTYRIVPKPGAAPRHPAECPNCGWNTRRVDPCRLCGRTAHFLGDDGSPVHKACLEEDITRRLAGGGPQ